MREKSSQLIKSCGTLTDPATETRSIGLPANALAVMVFARHLDNFIMTKGFSSFYQLPKTGSGQFLQPGQIYLSPGLAKIAPWCLAHRDSFAAKAPGRYM